MKRDIKAISFTPKYDELEDRIRLSINYDDIQNRVDFMMTRAFILKLLPTLDEYMQRFYNLDLAPVKPAQTNTKEQAQSSESTSLTDGANLELYAQGDELLIEVKLSYVKKTNISIVQFISKQSVATAQLDANAMKQVFTIIKSTIPFFSWGISQNI